MPTTFANTIDGNPLYAARAVADAAGNDIQATYATKSEIVNADWDAVSGNPGYIENKPVIPAAQVNADWDATSGLAQILNKPTIPSVDQTYDATSTNAQSGVAVASAVANAKLFEALYGTTTYAEIVAAIAAKKVVYCRIDPYSYSTSRMAILSYIGSGSVEFQYYRSANPASSGDPNDTVYIYTVTSSGWSTTTRTVQKSADWNAASGPTSILNKPTIPAAQVNADWDAVSGAAEILNKPVIPAGVPTVTSSDNNKTLVSTYNNGVGSYAWAQNTFVAVYGTTTYAEIKAAIDAGYNVLCLKTDNTYQNSSFAGGIGYIYRYGNNKGNIEFNYFQAFPNDNQATALNQGIAIVHIWKVAYNNTWTASTVVVSPKIVASSPLSLSYSNTNREVTLGVSLGSTLTTSNDAIEVAAPIPDVTSVDDGKVLKATYSGGVGSYAWETESGGGGSVTDVEVNGTSVVNASGVAEVSVPAQVQTDWDATSGLGEILNKPVVMGMAAGSGITITESGSSITIAADAQIPSYDTTTDVGKVLQVTANGLAWVSLS